MLLPAGLAGLRWVCQQHGPTPAALVGGASLAVLLWADAAASRARAQQADAAARRVSAATLQHRLHASAAGDGCELATLRAASQTVTGSRSGQPPLAQPAAAAAPAAGQPEGGAGAAAGAATYASLLPTLTRLQAAVGVEAASSAASSHEQLLAGLQRLSAVLGTAAISPEMVATPAAAAATIAQLQQQVGIQA